MPESGAHKRVNGSSKKLKYRIPKEEDLLPSMEGTE